MAVKDIKSLVLKLNSLCGNAIQESALYCVNRTNYEITIMHFFHVMLEEQDSDFEFFLNHFEIDVEKFKAILLTDIEELKLGNSSRPVFSPILIKLIQDSWVIASIDLDQRRIRSGTILIALLNKINYYGNGEYVELLKNINTDTLYDEFFTITRKSAENEALSAKNSSNLNNNTAFLDKYCQDITKKAQDGKIDSIFGRDLETRLMIDILARRKKNNPICVGEPGVGKSAVVEGLALKIVKGEVPPLLKNVKILELDLTLLQAGAGMKGEFENRLKGVIKEIQESLTPIILFIDEAHTLIGAGGSAGTDDAANLLKPALARGELRTIAATTWGEYKKYFEKDAALERRFQMIKLEEPSVDTATLILRGIKSHYEIGHGVKIQDRAVVAAVELSNKYITGRYLPDKAIDLLDTACARVKINLNSKPAMLEDKEQMLKAKIRENKALQRDLNEGVVSDETIIDENKKIIKKLEKELKELDKHWVKELKLARDIIKIKQSIQEVEDESKLQGLKKELDIKNNKFEKIKERFNLVETEVNPDVVAKIVSDWTSIPLGKMLRDESQTILELDSKLKEKIKGQDSALNKISEIIRSSKAGIKDPNQPTAVFLLTGPSGIGKTQTAIEIADLLFGNKKALTVINMGEFQEKHSVSKLIGSPAGYVGYGEGGVLSEAVRQKPYSVVLLDEVEKAHPDILNLFYQVFDKGILVDAEGKEINFRDVIIILTSNVASKTIEDLFSKDQEVSMKDMQDAIRPNLTEYLSPALLARMNILPFKPLSQDSLKEIVKMKLIELQERLENNKIKLFYDERITDIIASKVINSNAGARYIGYILDSDILPKISKKILENLVDKDKVENITLSIEGSEIAIHPCAPEEL